MAVFNDTWASLGPQPAGDIPSRYHLMPPSHLCALCWLQAGTGLTHSQGEGLTRGGGPGAGHGSHCVACLARHGPPRPLGPHQLGLLWSCPSSLPPRCGHQNQSVWKQTWHWLRAAGQPAMAFTPAHHGLNTELRLTGLEAGRMLPDTHSRTKSQLAGQPNSPRERAGVGVSVLDRGQEAPGPGVIHHTLTSPQGFQRPQGCMGSWHPLRPLQISRQAG